MRLPSTYRNWLSYIGTILAISSLSAFLFLFALSYFYSIGTIYLGLVLYLIIPSFLVLGLLLIPAGMFIRRRNEKRRGIGAEQKWIVVDFNNPSTRNAAAIFIGFTIIFIILTAFGTYQGYHYSESVEFCGKLCHQIMQPEYTTYQTSPHARVKCVECHIGEGAEWMVKSKVSGIRQVFKAISGTYPRPVPTPIVNLRPARETCEKCHWPQKFFASQIRDEKYFLTDSLNTQWEIILKLKIGENHEALGQTNGIHWHINTDYKIEYAASDPKRETIPWVKLTNTKTGEVFVFNDEMNTITADSLKKLPKRTMDCMDCHNRPSHNFKSPPNYVNNLFVTNKIPTTIPYLMKSAMSALYGSYPTIDTAYMEIKKQMISFYKDQYPEIWNKYSKQILSAIPEIQKAYAANTFPAMKTTYLEYSQHIGHLETNGCFRCHDDNHKTKQGKTISRDCNLCHTILGQGKPGSMAMSSVDKGLEFEHPVDIKGAWKSSFCYECHNILF